LEQAQQLFEEAEKMQQERRPEYRFLYSLAGYLYCDLLLSTGQWEAVLERAGTTLEWVKNQNWLLDIALDQLSLARAHAIAHIQTPAETTLYDQANQFFGLAATGLRHRADFLPHGLLHRAAWRTQLGQYPEALEDLKEVFEIADGSQMGLFLADYHLEMGRWHRAQGQDEPAEKHKAEALSRILKMGYLRRLAEAEAI
jgi:tetratricopeptide (TPR) repeat protein